MKHFFPIHRGFTLIELAIVIFIIGLLLGGLLVPYATSVEQKNREQARKQLQEIQEALYGYAIVNGRLPCPDCEASSAGCSGATRDDGMEDKSGNYCAITENGTNPNEGYVGNLPWATLNVPQFDAWGYAYTYRVSKTFSRAVSACTASGGSCTACNSAAAFDLCAAGTMNISTTDGGTANVAQNIPAIVISHGKNHYENSQTAEEMENYERDPKIFGTSTSILSSYTGDSANSFVYKDYTRDSNGNISFDDMMIWISPYLLKNKLMSAGKLP